jgi:hypothetical protein
MFKQVKNIGTTATQTTDNKQLKNNKHIQLYTTLQQHKTRHKNNNNNISSNIA